MRREAWIGGLALLSFACAAGALRLGDAEKKARQDDDNSFSGALARASCDDDRLKQQRSSFGGSSGIPQVLHLLWPNKNFTFPDISHDFETKEARATVLQLLKLNPGWCVRVWDDADCEQIVRTEHPEFLPYWLQMTPTLKRFDAVRPVILQKYGGIYLDVDMECHRPFGPLVEGKKALFRENWQQDKFPGPANGNHLMGSASGHPIWESYIRGMIADQQSSGADQQSVVQHTGNGRLTKAVKEFYDRNPTETATLRLLSQEEVANEGQCGRDAGCADLICKHMHYLSPVEDQKNGDDNAERQKRQSAMHNRQQT